jgi:hypothetical protein
MIDSPDGLFSSFFGLIIVGSRGDWYIFERSDLKILLTRYLVKIEHAVSLKTLLIMDLLLDVDRFLSNGRPVARYNYLLMLDRYG